MKAIARHQEGITINPYEFLLDAPKGNVKLFETDEEAVNYLNQKLVNTTKDDPLTKEKWSEVGIHIIDWEYEIG